jgi:protein-arginine kinase activator protein McsA
LLELRQRLRRAVESEAFEEAARLRDLIRRKEASDASG